MAEQFPDISHKLSVPQKKSLFERNRADAEAKRQRAEAETAAALTDFVKSFDDEPGDILSNVPTKPRAFGGQDGSGARAGGGPPKRHFGGAIGRNSGPGSLGPAPNIVSKKRAFDGTRVHESRGIFGHDDEKPAPLDAATAFKTSDDEAEPEEAAVEEDTSRRAIPKPTIQLSSLPPGCSTAFIKELLPTNLKVGAVRIVTPQDTGDGKNTARSSNAAIVTLAQDTPASEIDTVVNNLQNKYLGWGYYLSLSRHLSSAGLSSLAHSSSATKSLPFGAKQPPQAASDHLRGRPPPGQHRGGFAPPESYDTPAYGADRGPGSKIQVQVQPPQDIAQIKLIHKTVEQLVSHGPEFEALLMTRPEVQRDEKWAWIWDARSPGGVWYRWRIWEIVTGSHSHHGPPGQPSQSLLFQKEPLWSAPEANLPYEFTTSLDEFVSDSAYDSSEEDESDSDGDDNPRKRRRQLQHANGPPAPVDANADVLEKSFLNPLHRAKLTHLLSRLPNTQARLRRGDVARITIFAIKHASEGAEEIVDMLVGNVLRPLSSSTCGKQEQELAKLVDSDRYRSSASPPPSRNGGPSTDADVEMRDSSRPSSSAAPPDPTSTSTSTPTLKPLDASTTTTPKSKKEDTTPSSLLALHLISDILSASSTSGVRHAWRYRSLFETALRRSHVFARLGRMDREHGWGRLKAEKWKRSLLGVLSLWEGWSVFETGAQAAMRKAVEEPPLTEEEAREKREKERAEKKAKVVGKSRWKTVTKDAAASAGEATPDPMDVDAKPEATKDADDVRKPGRDAKGGGAIESAKPGAERDESSVGNDDTSDDKPKPQAQQPPPLKRTESPLLPGETAAAAAKRRRPKAMDLLGD